MDQDEELGSQLLVAVDELGLTGLWANIKEVLESRVPLRGVTMNNKLGRTVTVDRLPVMFLQSTDRRLTRLKPFSHSPVVWFRNPYVHIFLVSSADINEYRAHIKGQVRKAISEVEKEWGGPTVASEWMVLYVRPFELDTYDKAAKKVFDKLRDEFSGKKRERVVRLDLPQRAFDARGKRIVAFGCEELDACLKDCIRAGFEARQAAYTEEVKRLLNERLEPSWSFATLYLVKDSLALMLEAAGMVDDAFQEVVELETCYLEALERGVMAASEFGANVDGDDAASLMSASWRMTRRGVLKKNGVPEFSFRQYLFAAQARLLLKLGRPIDVADRGLRFVHHTQQLLAARQAAGKLRPLFKECWGFSACMALISAVRASIAQASEESGSGAPLDDPSTSLTLSSAAAHASATTAAAAAAGTPFGFGTFANTAASNIQHSNLRQGPAPSVGIGSGSFGGSVGQSHPHHHRASSADAVGGMAAAAAAASGNQQYVVVGMPQPSSPRYSHSQALANRQPTVAGGGSGRPSGAVAGSGSGSPEGSPYKTAGSGNSSSRLRFSGDTGSAHGPVAVAVPASADVEHDASGGVDWQLGSPTDLDLPPLDPSSLGGAAVAPAVVSTLMQDPDVQLRNTIERRYQLILGHLYNAACHNVLQLGRQTQLVVTRSTSASDSSSAAAHSATTLGPGHAGAAMCSGHEASPATSELQQPLLQYHYSQLAGGYADRSEDVRFEATPLQQATQAQILRAGGTDSIPQVHVPANRVARLTYSDRVGSMVGLDAPGTPTKASRLGRSVADSADSFSDASGSAHQPAGLHQSTAAYQQQPQPQHAGGHIPLPHMSSGGGNGLQVQGSNGPPPQQQEQLSGGHGFSSVPVGDDELPPTIALSSFLDRAGGSHRSDDSKPGEDRLTGHGYVSTAQPPPRPHSHSGSAESGFFQKFDLFASKMTAMLDRPSSVLGHHPSSEAVSLARSSAPRPPFYSLGSTANSASAGGAAGGGGGYFGFGGMGSGHFGSGIARSEDSRTDGLPSPRQVELQVDDYTTSLFGSGTSPLRNVLRLLQSNMGSKTNSAADLSKAVTLDPAFSWISDWRLQLALSSLPHLSDLLLQLTLSAASCYSQAGRVRNAALLYADVAEDLAGGGHAEAAVLLLQHLLQPAAWEGWNFILGRLLPLLISCQTKILHPLLLTSCIRLLSLQPSAVAPSDRLSAHRCLLQCCCVDGEGDDDNLETSGSHQSGHARYHNAMETGGLLHQLSAHQALQVAPIDHQSSSFYGAGRSHDTGQLWPLLQPPAVRVVLPGSIAKKGAQLVSVGDVALISVDVYSNLPEPLSFSSMALSLGCLESSSSPTPDLASSQAAHHNHGTYPTQQAQPHIPPQQPLAHQPQYAGQPHVTVHQQQQQGGLASHPQHSSSQLPTSSASAPAPLTLPVASSPLSQSSDIWQNKNPSLLHPGTAAHSSSFTSGVGGFSHSTVTHAPPPQTTALQSTYTAASAGALPVLNAQSLPYPATQPQHTTALTVPSVSLTVNYPTGFATAATAATPSAFGPAVAPGVPGGFHASRQTAFGSVQFDPQQHLQSSLQQQLAHNADSVDMPLLAGASIGQSQEATGLNCDSSPALPASSWVEGDDVECCALVSIAQTNTRTAGRLGVRSVISGLAATATNVCKDQQQEQQQTAAAAALLPSATGVQAAARDVTDQPLDVPPKASAFEHAEASRTCSQRHLMPGLSRLTFRIVPSQPGMFFLKHLTVTCGSCELRLDPVSPQHLAGIAVSWGSSGSQARLSHGAEASPHLHNNSRNSVSAGGPMMSDAAGKGGADRSNYSGGLDHSVLSTLGTINACGGIKKELILLQVQPMEQRLAVAAVAIGGSLIAGMHQWLGVVITPSAPRLLSHIPHADHNGLKAAGKADASALYTPGLEHVRLHLQPPGSAAGPSSGATAIRVQEPSFAHTTSSPFPTTATAAAAAAAAATAAYTATATPGSSCLSPYGSIGGAGGAAAAAALRAAAEYALLASSAGGAAATYLPSNLHGHLHGEAAALSRSFSGAGVGGHSANGLAEGGSGWFDWGAGSLGGSWRRLSTAMPCRVQVVNLSASCASSAAPKMVAASSGSRSLPQQLVPLPTLSVAPQGGFADGDTIRSPSGAGVAATASLPTGVVVATAARSAAAAAEPSPYTVTTFVASSSPAAPSTRSIASPPSATSPPHIGQHNPSRQHNASTSSGQVHGSGGSSSHQGNWTTLSRHQLDLSQALGGTPGSGNNGEVTGPVLVWLPVLVSEPFAAEPPVTVTVQLMGKSSGIAVDHLAHAPFGAPASGHGNGLGKLEQRSLPSGLLPRRDVLSAAAAAAGQGMGHPRHGSLATSAGLGRTVYPATGAAAGYAGAGGSGDRVTVTKLAGTANGDGGCTDLHTEPFPVCVEYATLAGGGQAHSRTLQVPVRPAFRLALKAHQLPNRDVLINVRALYDVHTPCDILSCHLQLHPGLTVAHGPSSTPGLLPMHMRPGSQVAWTFLLNQQAPGEAADILSLPPFLAQALLQEAAAAEDHAAAACSGGAGHGHSSVCITYRLHANAPLPPGKVQIVDDSHGCISSSGGSGYDPFVGISGGAAALPSPPSAPPPPHTSESQSAPQHQQLLFPHHQAPTAFGGGEATSGGGASTPAPPATAAAAGGQVCSFTLNFSLAFEEDPTAQPPARRHSVQAKLLGPWVMTAGRAVALTWQLTRVPHSNMNEDEDEGDEVLHYKLGGNDAHALAVRASAANGDGHASQAHRRGRRSRTHPAWPIAAMPGRQHADAGDDTPPTWMPSESWGVIRLGKAIGSVAFIESMMSPVAAVITGGVPGEGGNGMAVSHSWGLPPRLRLRGVHLGAVEVQGEEVTGGRYIMIQPHR